MLELSLIWIFLVASTVVIHAIGTTHWVGYLLRRWSTREGHWRPHAALPVVTSTAIVLLMLHAIEVILWALAYQVLVPAGQLDTFEEAAYFSLVTFTTLGYGDITLGPDWRLLSGIEALNGILLVGWSTAVMFAVVERYWMAVRKQQIH